MSEVKTYRDLYEALKAFDPAIAVEISALDVKFCFCGTVVRIESDDMPHFSSSYFKAEQLKPIVELISTFFDQREFDEFKTFVENGCKDKQEEEQTEHDDPEYVLSDDERLVLDYLKDYYCKNSFNALSSLCNLKELIMMGENNLNDEKANLVRTWNMLEDSRKDKIIGLLAIAGDEFRRI